MNPALTLPVSRPALLALAVVWALLLVGGFFWGAPHDSGTHRMPTWTRMASSFTLVIAAWAWLWFARGTTADRYSLLIAVGMTLGFVGDLFLAQLLPGREPVLGGIGAFGLGHIAYVAAILSMANRHGLDAPGPRWGALAVCLAVGAVGWFLLVSRGNQPALLRWAALPYALLLASTAGFATGLAVQAGQFIPLSVGASLFLVSDLILAGQLFSGLFFPLIGDVIWFTYGPGQMLIVFSLLPFVTCGTT
jgi:hypothetical protein